MTQKAIPWLSRLGVGHEADNIFPQKKYSFRTKLHASNKRKKIVQQLWQRQLIVNFSARSAQIYGCIKVDKEWRIRYNT